MCGVLIVSPEELKMRDTKAPHTSCSASSFHNLNINAIHLKVIKSLSIPLSPSHISQHFDPDSSNSAQRHISSVNTSCRIRILSSSTISPIRTTPMPSSLNPPRFLPPRETIIATSGYLNSFQTVVPLTSRQLINSTHVCPEIEASQ